MTSALRNAGVAPDEIDYIVAHGTATQLNDVTETRAIKAAYGDHAYKVAISSPKSMIGHLVGAAGIASALAAIGAIRDGVIPPTANLHTPDPECDLDYVPLTARAGEGGHGRGQRLRVRRPERGGHLPVDRGLTSWRRRTRHRATPGSPSGRRSVASGPTTRIDPSHARRSSPSRTGWVATWRATSPPTWPSACSDGALEPGGVPDGPALVAAIERANAAIRVEAVARPDQRGMGTTCTVLVVGDTVTIAHVGDSRAYRSRGGRLEQLTEDHSLVAALVREGRLDPDAAAAGDPRRHVITRALGAEDGIRVDVVTVDRLPGDRFLLCSDGVHGQLDDATIGRVLAGTSEPGAAADELVALADAAGGEDNATVVVIDADRVAPGLRAATRSVVGCAGPGRPAPVEAGRGGPACRGAHRRGAHRRGGGLAGRGRARSGSADPSVAVGGSAVGGRAVGVGARAFGVDPGAVAVAVTREPGAVRVGRDPDAVVRGAGAVLTAARPSAAGRQARSRRPSNASSAATCSADSGIGLSVS